MAAKRKKVIVDADLRHLQGLFPDTGQLPFNGVARRHIGSACDAQVGLGQCLAVDLAILRERQFVERDEVGGHHVVRQDLQQSAAGAFRVDIADDIRHQPLTARHHGHVAYFRKRRQRRFDLAQFNAEAANFHLFVDPAEVVDAAVGKVARQVARAVQARARHGTERMRDKLF